MFFYSICANIFSYTIFGEASAIKYNFVSREYIDKGWSDDKKYRAYDESGASYLLRVSAPERSTHRENCCAFMLRAAELGVPMCRVLDYGMCGEGFYCVHSWIDGSDAEEIMPTLPEKQQWDYGIAAGKALQKIHSIPAPENAEDWQVRFGRKMDTKTEKYLACPIKYPGGDNFIRFISKNRHLLKNRPQSMQHGDYHIGNMMIDKGGALQIIDFDRYDWGDPWEEFNRIVWCAQTAPAFASGMVYGYFGGKIPDEFWHLLALYISSNALSSIYWAIPFGQGEVDVMLKQGAEILDWYDNMNTAIPSWFSIYGD